MGDIPGLKRLRSSYSASAPISLSDVSYVQPPSSRVPRHAQLDGPPNPGSALAAWRLKNKKKKKQRIKAKKNRLSAAEMLCRPSTRHGEGGLRALDADRAVDHRTSTIFLFASLALLLLFWERRRGVGL